MTVLPSPIPHPLDYCPWELPGWAYEAIEWVVGFQWPAGDEAATWDVADRWYGLVQALAEPRLDAFGAAAQVIDGYGGEGVTAQGFIDAWNRLAADENAPLNALLDISNEIGAMVEQAGRDIEGAKLEAWIELGIFVIELIGMAVAVAMTLGAASPAAGGLIAATRIAIQQIFKRLAEQLGRKAIRKTLTSAARQVTTGEGLRKLGREAGHEAVDEAREELATNASIQAYQNSTGRAHGVSWGDLGMSGAAGAAGGFAAGGAQAGGGQHGGLLRGAAAEVLGEFGGAAVGGDLPGLESVAKSAGSGVAGAGLHETRAGVTSGLAGLSSSSSLSSLSSLSPVGESAPAGPADLDRGPADVAPAFGGAGRPDAGVAAGDTEPAGSEPAAPSGVPEASSRDAAMPASLSSGGLPDPSPAGDPLSPDVSTSGPSPPDGPSTPDPLSPDVSTSRPSPPDGPSTPDPLSLDVSTSRPSPPDGPSTPDPLSSWPPVAGSDDPSLSGWTYSGSSPAGPIVTSPLTSAPLPDLDVDDPGAPDHRAGAQAAGASAVASPSVPGSSSPHPPPAGTSPPGHPGAPLPPAAATVHTGVSGGGSVAPPPSRTGIPPAHRVDDRAAAPPRPAPRPDPHPSAPDPRPQRPPLGSDPGRHPPAIPAAHVPDIATIAAAAAAARVSGWVPPPTPPDHRAGRQGYFDNAAEQRAAYAATVRRAEVEALRAEAVRFEKHARQLRRAARLARWLRFDPHAANLHDGNADILVDRALQIEERIAGLENGTIPYAPATVDERSWHRLNADAGMLAYGPIGTGSVSALTGDDHPPSIDRTRPYDRRGGLRAPLAEHQLDLEAAVPRDGRGDPVRLADPRSAYFSLINDGGPAADPTRGINCQDCVLSFYETYMHGRPRVSAPRTFDGYLSGEPRTVQDGEIIGPERVEHATSGRFQSLCGDLSRAHPAVARQAVDQSFAEVSTQLIAGGPGSFAFLVTAWEGGSSHAWAAVNQDGEILFLDPQSARIAANPLYPHTGHPDPANVVAMDALVVDGHGVPMTFPHREDGTWHPHETTLPPAPPRPSPIAISAADRAATADRRGPNEATAESRTDPPIDPPTHPDSSSDRKLAATHGTHHTPLDRGVRSGVTRHEPPEPSPGPEPEPPPDRPPSPGPEPEPPPDRPPSPGPEPDVPRPAPPPRPAPIPSPRRPIEDLAGPDAEVERRPAPVDRIAEALGPRPAPTPMPSPLTAEDLLSAVPHPRVPADDDATERRAYFGYAGDARTRHELQRREDQAAFFAANADHYRVRAARLNEHADGARRQGATLAADRYRADARELSEIAAELDDLIEPARAGELAPAQEIVDGADWARINDDVGDLADSGPADGSVAGQGPTDTGPPDSGPPDTGPPDTGPPDTGPPDTGPPDTGPTGEGPTDSGPTGEGPADGLGIDGPGTDGSGLTGHDLPPPIERTRPYDRRGGLRRPLAVHQKDLENAMPRGGDGRVRRLADPRAGRWFALANDGGPAADPTRGINCVDGVLSLFETYMHGRPRVSAPRTFDAYARGDTTRPLGAESGGLARIETTVGGTFQGLCPYVGDRPAEQARRAVDAATATLQHHLRDTGHGAYAFVVAEAANGGAHTWAAVNQNGTILFLDPQTGRLAEENPLYTDGVVAMDALVVNSQAEVAPLPSHTPGVWSQRALAPTGSAPPPDELPSRRAELERTAETSAQAAERAAYESLTEQERTILRASHVESLRIADHVLSDLSAVVTSLNESTAEGRLEIVGTEHRVKREHSLGRAFAGEAAVRRRDLARFLDHLKDRVRFSVQVPEDDYGRLVDRTLQALTAMGYRVDELVNFWGGDRHNGLNVTVRDPAGSVVELQFPTKLSWDVGRATHRLYEIIRQSAFTPTDRVEAYLEILATVKKSGISARQPGGLVALGEMRSIDSSFATWIRRNGGVWRRYSQKLDSDGKTFARVLERYGLDHRDVFGTHRSDDENDRPEVRVSGRPGSRHVESGIEPDRLPGTERQPAAGGDLERPPAGMDVLPGAGREVPLRRPLLRRDEGGGPADGRADGTGDVAHGAAERADPAGDVRRGPADGLDLRPTGDVAGFDVVGDDSELAGWAMAGLLEAFARDPRLAEAVVDGRRAGMTIDAAVRALRGAVAALERSRGDLPSGLRMTVRTGDGSSVAWHAGTGVISVSV